MFVVTTVNAMGRDQARQQYGGERGGVDDRKRRGHQMLDAERRVIADAKANNAPIWTLALKIAELQAHLMRLDALGDQLVDVSKLDR